MKILVRPFLILVLCCLGGWVQGQAAFLCYIENESYLLEHNIHRVRATRLDWRGDVSNKTEYVFDPGNRSLRFNLEENPDHYLIWRFLADDGMQLFDGEEPLGPLLKDNCVQQFMMNYSEISVHHEERDQWGRLIRDSIENTPGAMPVTVYEFAYQDEKLARVDYRHYRLMGIMDGAYFREYQWEESGRVLKVSETMIKQPGYSGKPFVNIVQTFKFSETGLLVYFEEKRGRSYRFRYKLETELF